MQLTTKQKQQLKAQAHKLKPVVLIGNNGLSPAVQLEVERALTDHELIKIRIQAEDRVQRKQFVDTLCQERGAILIQMIGNICVLYRKKEHAAS